jgi:hypothetical protein
LAIDAARTESTRRVYAYLWGQWARWCTTRGLNPLPGEPAALCAYLTERAAAGIAVSSPATTSQRGSRWPSLAVLAEPATRLPGSFGSSSS